MTFSLPCQGVRCAVAQGALLLLAVAHGGAAAAQDASCKSVFGAIRLQAGTPNHQFISISSGDKDSQAQSNEIINTGRARYLRLARSWQVVPGSPQEFVKREEDNFRDSHTVCRWVRDELIAGRASNVYVEESQTGTIKSAGVIWIEKSTGLPLREQIDTDPGTGPAAQRRLDIRIEYTGVKAPVLVKP